MMLSIAHYKLNSFNVARLNFTGDLLNATKDWDKIEADKHPCPCCVIFVSRCLDRREFALRLLWLQCWGLLNTTSNGRMGDVATSAPSNVHSAVRIYLLCLNYHVSASGVSLFCQDVLTKENFSWGCRLQRWGLLNNTSAVDVATWPHAMCTVCIFCVRGSGSGVKNWLTKMFIV